MLSSSNESGASGASEAELLVNVARVLEQCECYVDRTSLKNGGQWEDGGEGSTYYCVYHLIVLDPESMRVLVEVLPDKRLGIPRVIKTNPNRHAHSNREVEALVESEIGPRTRLIHLLWCEVYNDKDRKDLACQLHGMYVMDTEEASRKSRAPWEWVDEKDLLRYDWVERCDEFDVGRKVLELFCEARTHEDQSGERRNPWYLVGWHGKAMFWIRSELEAKEIRIVSEIGQDTVYSDRGHFMQCDISGRSRSSGVKRQKESENLYIKCTLPRFREAERTTTIGRVIGDICVEVIGVNKELGIMLLGDAGKMDQDTLDEGSLMEKLTEMQRRSANRVDELIEGGLEVRDGKWLEENIDRILNHGAFEVYYYNWDVGDKMDYLRSKVQFIEKAGRDLALIGAPNVLVHGDFQLHNFGERSTEGKKLYRVFDWEHSFVGNRFHDYIALDTSMEVVVKLGGKLDVDRGKLWKKVKEAFKRETKNPVAYDDASLLQLVRIVGATHYMNQTLEYFGHLSETWIDSNTSTMRLAVEELFDSVKALENNADYRTHIR